MAPVLGEGNSKKGQGAPKGAQEAPICHHFGHLFRVFGVTFPKSKPACAKVPSKSTNSLKINQKHTNHFATYSECLSFCIVATHVVQVTQPCALLTNCNILLAGPPYYMMIRRRNNKSIHIYIYIYHLFPWP